MSDKSKYISKIGELREKAGFTQRDLALKLNVTVNTIQNWEKNRSMVQQIARLSNLCQILDCDLKDLIEDQDIKPLKQETLETIHQRNEKKVNSEESRGE